MSVIHLCTICCRRLEEHPEECDCGTPHFPALCCPGCDCGSYEEAHPPATPAERYEALVTDGVWTGADEEPDFTGPIEGSPEHIDELLDEALYGNAEPGAKEGK